MNELQIFNNPDFGQVRMVMIEDTPYFVGKDVAEALGYLKTENAIANHVDEEDKTSTLIQGSGSNYKSKAIVINESGVYALVFSSKLPTAKKFKRWVTSEVLPAIRKTGSYSQPKPVELPKPRRSILEVQSLDFGDDMELRIMKMVGDYADIEVLIGYAIVDMAVKRGLYTADLAATCLNKGMEAYVHTRQRMSSNVVQSAMVTKGQKNKTGDSLRVPATC